MINSQDIMGHAKALVIGISHYQDAEIQDLQLPHRDAELFASFLHSNQINRIDDDNVMLVTNSDATSARVASALDWLFDGATAQDTLILYFAGYGMDQKEYRVPPSKLYFYDTPYNNSDAGSFDLFHQFYIFTEAIHPFYKVFGNIYPLLVSPELRQDSIKPKLLKKRKEHYKHLAFVNTIDENTYQKTYQELSNAKVSLSHLLLDGMYGLADKNKDRFVTFKELENFLNDQIIIPETWPGALFAASSSTSQKLALTDQKVLSKLSQIHDPLLSAFVNSETKSYESTLIQKLSEASRLLYQDFIVSVKLGHLVLPADRNATSLADSLLKLKEFEPLFGEIRRKLAAAYQDETQQALNAYLNSDSREMSRRRNSSELYRLYPKYLELAVNLLGEKHYMANILKAKKYYFEGLIRRIEGQQKKNLDIIREALAIQLQALALENEAAFIYNEVAIDYQILGDTNAAKINFQSAIEYSPGWSIPFSNFAQLYMDHDLPKALRIAKHAIRLSPRNSFAYNIEGMVYLQSGDFVNAEASFSKALRNDLNYMEVYYNMACLKSLQGNFVSAKTHFESAVQNGFIDFEFAFTDPDLVGLRQQKEWKEIEKKLKIKN
jgi:tetratricopeptide (TPR) repeat protein